MPSQSNNPYPTLAMYEFANEYDRLNLAFSRVAQAASKLSGCKIGVDLDGFADQPATVMVRIDGIDWSRAEEKVEETLRDVVEALAALGGAK